MWIKERWPGVFENALYDALIRLGVAMGVGSIVTAFFNWVGELPSWALFNIFVVVFVAVLFSMIFIQLRRIGPRLGPKTPPERLERIVRSWLDDFHYPVQRHSAREDRYFALIVRRAPRNIPIEIMRPRKEREQFLVLLTQVNIADELKEKWNSLQERVKQRIGFEIMLELSRQKIAGKIEHQQSIAVQTMIPIDELTQAKLADGIAEIDHAVSLISSKLTLLLNYDELMNKEEN